jgi:Protein of unknown function (DUF3365)
MVSLKLPVCGVAAFLMMAQLSAGAQDTADPEMQSFKKEAAGAIKGLAQNLKKELKAALKSGGPVKAIEVCNTVAPSIAAAQSQERGLDVRRTALKLRNPDNAPDEFERKVLEKFVADIAAGKDPKALAYAEAVKTDDGTELRFMKAIPTGELCLKCHGGNVAPEVKAAIGKLYPEDQATGFKAGDLRGAFSVSKKL